MTNWVLIPMTKKPPARTVWHLARPGRRSACGSVNVHHDQVPFDPATHTTDSVTCAICRRTNLYYQFSDRQTAIESERIQAFWAAPPEVQKERTG